MARRLLSGVLLAVALWTGSLQPSRAQDDVVSVENQGAIQSVIRQQMDAFRRDDGVAAFAFAAPRIQQLFGTPERFMDIVRHGYQPVYAPRAVDFTTTVLENGAVMQSVELIGPDGLAYTALYTMEHEADGSWRIAACVLLESRRLGA